MPAATSSFATEVASVKKALIKTPSGELGRSEALSDAIRLSTQRTIPAHHLDQLALLLALLRQLRAAVPKTDGGQQQDLLETIQHLLAPAILPRGVIADLLICNLESSHKANQARAGECVGALARLSIDIAPISTSVLSIEPLLLSTCRSGLATRPGLILVANLLEAVRGPSIPSDLLSTTLDGMDLGDNGPLRTTIAVGILGKLRSAGAYNSDEQMLQPILPLLSSSASPTTTTNAHRYLLPALFKAFPNTVSTLLSLVSDIRNDSGSENDLTSWISIAALGVSLGVIDLQQLPQQDLHDALQYEDPVIRIKAYELVTGCKDVIKLLTPEGMALVKESLMINIILPGLGSRSDFSASTHTFFAKLKEAPEIIQRRRKKALDDQSSTALKQAQTVLEEFHTWFFACYIDPALISARRIPVHRPLLALHLLEIYVHIFGDEDTVRKAVYTERRVQLLIGCQASEFTEVRVRARNILCLLSLNNAPTPLPGYPSIDSPNSKILLKSAYASFSNPRRTQNDAAVAGLCILFEKVILPDDHSADSRSSVAFVSSLVDRIEAELIKGEEGIKLGLDDLALHGLLSAAKALIGCLDLTSEPAQQVWRPTLHRLSALVGRVWQLTRNIMSLSSSAAGSLKSSNSSAGPAHEIAKAYQVLSNAQDEDGDGDVDPRRIVSACWRATKEAADLLSALFTQPILQGGNSQTVWTQNDVDRAGKQFLEWMHEIRHRGTFSKVSVAFARLVEAVRRSSSIEGLAGEWLELELKAIMDDTLSTTRRSAALPYSLLAIVAGNEALLDKAIDRLIDLSRLDNAATSDITRVHCFNILKIVLLDARQTSLFHKYFERTVMTAVAAFSSANWNVRNVGLILFSTLVHRSLSPSRGAQDFYQSRATLATRQTYASWSAKYPKLLPYMVQCMEKYTQGPDNMGTIPTAQQHTPLFPMLIIIRSLQWSEKGKGIQDALKRVVRPHLASPEIQVREVAAQAMSSLLSPKEALEEISTQPPANNYNFNAIHGHLLLLLNLLDNTVDWQTCTRADKVEIQTMIRQYDQYDDLPCPPIRGAHFSCISSYMKATEPVTEWFGVRSLLQASNVIKAARSFLPGDDNLAWTASDLLLSHQPTSELILTLLQKPAEQDRLSALWRLPELPASCLTEDVFRRVLHMATNRTSGDAVQIVALDSIASTWNTIPWSKVILDGVSANERIEVLEKIGKLVESKIIPLKEAALPAMAWALAWVLEIDRKSIPVETTERVGREILDASQISQSQPRREAAARALSKMTIYLFPTSSKSGGTISLDTSALLILHRSLLRLLQDDDEDVRLIAAEIVKNGLQMRRAVVQSRAVDAWWAWLEGYLADCEARMSWIQWLEELVLNKEDTEEGLDVLRRHHASAAGEVIPTASVELFEVEKPNLFRDPLDDARHAAELLARLQTPQPASVEELQFDEKQRAIIGVCKSFMQTEEGLVTISPIDEAFGIVAILPEYIKVLERVVPGRKGQGLPS